MPKIQNFIHKLLIGLNMMLLDTKINSTEKLYPKKGKIT